MSKIAFKIAKHKKWRKGQDSNLRYFRMLVFKTSALNHSATLPSLIISYFSGKSKKVLDFLFHLWYNIKYNN